MTKAGRYAAGLVLAGLVAGCGAGGHKPSATGTPRTPADALDQAAKRLGSVSSYQASVSLSSVVSGSRKHLFGEVAARTKDQAVQYDVPFTTTGDDDPGSSRVLVGNRIYLKNLLLLQLIHKPYVGFSFGGQQPADTLVMQLVAETRQPDPLLHARMFTASKDVHTVGRETVGGTPTTHYQGTFPLAAALTRLDAGERDVAQRMYGRFGATPFFEVWIDDQRLVRKVGVVSKRSAKRKLNVTMTYSTYDTPVAINPPPPGDVKDLGGSKAKGLPV
jgi:hypothetical protein